MDLLVASNKSQVELASRSHYLLRRMTQEEFQSQVESFIRRHGLSPTTFGIWAMDDSRFVFDVRKGRQCFRSTQDRVLAFIASYEKKQEVRELGGGRRLR